MYNTNKCFARVNFTEQCQNDIHIYNLCTKHYNDINVIKINEFADMKNISDEINKFTINIPQEKIIIYKNKPLKINKWDEYKYKKDALKSFITNYKEKYNNKSTKEILEEISGPAYFNPLLATNHCDPISLEDIWHEKDGVKKITLEMDKELLFSFKDNKNIWCFNIKSLRKLFLENKDNVKNPFTRETIQPDVIEKALIKIEILEDNNVLDLIEQDYEINNNKINIMLEDILHKLNNMNFLNIEKKYFFDLNNNSLIRFYNDLKIIFKENLLSNISLKDFYGFDITENNIFLYQEKDFNDFDKIMLQFAVLTTMLKMYKDEIIIAHIIIRAFGFVSSNVRNNYQEICS